ncbi:MAG: hypothetical protein K2H82_01715, partial [Oscillospiraceae bacterium]|nr:hypothetical protein [Oscillospiraceae bacterium]
PMEKAKRWFFVCILGCLKLGCTACSEKNDSAVSDSVEIIETIPMFETVPVMTVAASSETTTSSMEQTQTTSSETSETTTSSTEIITTTMETTTETTTTEMTTETTTETTTTTVPPGAIVSAPEIAPFVTTETTTADQLFATGIWWATGANGDRYFYFQATEHQGSFRDQENGIGQEFSYEANGNSVTFHIGSPADSTQASVSFTDSRTVVITWQNGSSETLVYQNAGGFDTFQYYSNIQLCEMALNYCEAHENYRPEMVGAAVQSDGKILIQLYDNLGDHNTTTAWYTVDRFTAQGTDAHGNRINLAE